MQDVVKIRHGMPDSDPLAVLFGRILHRMPDRDPFQAALRVIQSEVPDPDCDARVAPLLRERV